MQPCATTVCVSEPGVLAKDFFHPPTNLPYLKCVIIIRPQPEITTRTTLLLLRIFCMSKPCRHMTFVHHPKAVSALSVAFYHRNQESAVSQDTWPGFQFDGNPENLTLGGFKPPERFDPAHVPLYLVHSSLGGPIGPTSAQWGPSMSIQASAWHIMAHTQSKRPG